MLKSLLNKIFTAFLSAFLFLAVSGCISATKIPDDKPEFFFPFGETGPKYRCANWHPNGKCQHGVRADGDALIRIETN